MMDIKGLYNQKDQLDSDTISTASSSEGTTNEEVWSGVFGASGLLLQTSRALGILPAEAVKNKPSHITVGKEKEPSQIYKPNSSTRVYSFFLYLVGIGLGCVSIYYRTTAMLALIESKQDDASKDSVESVNLYFKLAYSLFTLLFCVIYALFSRFTSESFGNIFTCIDQVDESFHFSDHAPAAKRVIYQLLFSALVLPLAASDCYSMVTEFRLTDAPVWAHVGFAMHFLALLANVIVEQQFIAMCLALKERFEFLNLNLISLQPLVFPEYEHADVKFKTADFNEQLFAIARSEFAGALKYNKQKVNEGFTATHRSGLVTPSGPYVRSAWGKETTTNPINPINTGSIFESPPVSLKARLALLRRVHDSLSDIMGQVNGLYGGCLLASISFIFCGVLSLSYYVVNNALYPKPGGGNSVVISLVQSILWLLYLSARLIALAWACASTTKEAQRAGPLHQKLTRRTLDSSTKEELHLFSTQLLQRDIGFSVCGLFPLDFTLLYTVAGAVTTYLVILIQFQSVQPNTKNTNATSPSTISPMSTTPKSK